MTGGPADDGADELVPHGEQAQWVRVAVRSTAFEAEQLKLMLEEAGIPVLVRGLQPGIFGPGFQGVMPGGLDVCIPSPELERARELFGDLD